MTYVPEKRLLVYEKGPPRICSPRSELFSVVLFLSATATFPIWASAVKTGGISSPPGVWQLYLGHLLSCDHQTCQVCSLQGSRYLQQVWGSHVLSHVTYFLLNFSSSVTPPPGILRPGLRTFQYLPLGLTPLHGKFDLYCSKLGERQARKRNFGTAHAYCANKPQDAFLSSKIQYSLPVTPSLKSVSFFHIGFFLSAIRRQRALLLFSKSTN